MIIRAVHFHDGKFVELDAPAKEDVVLLTESWEFAWIDLDITGAGEEEVKGILGEGGLGFHPLTIEDCYVHQTYTPKVDDYESYQFYIFHYFVITPGESEVEARELNVYVGRNFVITVHRSELTEFSDGLFPLPDYLSTTSEKATLFLHHLLDVIMDAYISELNHIESMSDHIEEMIVAGASTVSRMSARGLVKEILALRRSLSVMRQSLQTERIIIEGIIRSQSPSEDAEEAEVVRYLRDLLDHLDRAIAILAHEKDNLKDIMDLHITLASDRTGEIIRVLTVISAVILPLMLIASIYGMNFKYMPELSTPWGYPLVWTVMAVIAGGLLIFFRRRGWI